MVSAVVSGSSGSGLSPGWDIVLCSWARHFTFTLSLSTQVYKWVPVNLMLGQPCDGLASHLGGSILRVASCYRNGKNTWAAWLVCRLNIFLWLVITWYYVIEMWQTLKDPTIIGSYDTIAAYADNDAVDFFKRNGFTDDVVLCSRFR